MIIDTNVLVGKWKYSEEDISVDRVKTLLASHSIDKAFTASTKGIFYNDISGNEDTRMICQGDHQFLAVATINLNSSIDYENEILLRKSQGFKAMRIFSEYQGFNYSSIRFKKLMKYLEKVKLPLIINANDRNNRSHIDEIACAVGEYDLPVIILDVIGYSLAEAIQAARYALNTYFSTRLLNTAGAIECFYESAGNRLVFGSGIPFFYGNQSVLTIQMARIDKNAKEAIFHKTIENIYGG